MNALARGLQVLEELTLASQPLGVTELSKRLGIDKSTTHRLLAILRGNGFAEQDPDTRLYRPTSKVIWLGSHLLARFDVRNHAAPYLRELAQKTGFASHLVILAQGRALYVGQERSPSTITVDIPIGGVAPPTCTAVGKALLADLDGGELRPYLERLEPHTAKTIVEPERLQADLALTRERGFAVDDEEFHIGVRCVASPIRDYAGRANAAIGVSGPAADLHADLLPQVAVTVRQVAEAISMRLGHYDSASVGDRSRPQSAVVSEIANIQELNLWN
jgi:DNA-binding IclR family transcriptional regulator